jgi:hypothetical protein
MVVLVTPLLVPPLTGLMSGSHQPDNCIDALPLRRLSATHQIGWEKFFVCNLFSQFPEGIRSRLLIGEGVPLRRHCRFGILTGTG